MLKLSSITTYIPYSPEWWADRLGKITSSKRSCLMGEKGIGVGGLTYIYQKVGEMMTGISSEKNITTEAIMFGIENEPKSLQYFIQKYEIPMLIVNKHLSGGEYFSSTPDALLVHRAIGDTYDCETVETKSYSSYEKHIRHCLCKTPQDIKKINPELYWQVIDQMAIADVVQGNALFYNPLFKEGEGRSNRVIFRKIDLINDFKLHKQRNEIIINEIPSIIKKLKQNT